MPRFWPGIGKIQVYPVKASFLEIYKSILADDGVICFKTDNAGLFEFSLEEFKECGFELRALTYDLHNSEYNDGNVETEYEKNFTAKGFTINRVEAYFHRPAEEKKEEIG